MHRMESHKKNCDPLPDRSSNILIEKFLVLQHQTLQIACVFSLNLNPVYAVL